MVRSLFGSVQRTRFLLLRSCPCQEASHRYDLLVSRFPFTYIFAIGIWQASSNARLPPRVRPGQCALRRSIVDAIPHRSSHHPRRWRRRNTRSHTDHPLRLGAPARTWVFQRSHWRVSLVYCVCRVYGSISRSAWSLANAIGPLIGGTTISKTCEERLTTVIRCPRSKRRMALALLPQPLHLWHISCVGTLPS